MKRQTILTKERFDLASTRELERWAHLVGHHHVYVIHEIEGPCKIGIADKPIRRFGSIRTSNPRELKMIKTWRMPGRAVSARIEKECHERLSEVRVRGEWFDVSPGLACSTVEMVIHDFELFTVTADRLREDIIHNLVVKFS